MLSRGVREMKLGPATVGLTDDARGHSPTLKIGTLIPGDGYSSLHNCRLDKRRLVGYEKWPPWELNRLLSNLYVTLRDGRHSKAPRAPEPPSLETAQSSK
jgi:hypothetical protein